MTAADRNHTADALTEVADYHVTECVDMHGDQGEDGPGPDCCFHARAAYTVGDAARLLRTPDTPTDSDTAARARRLLDAATPGPWHVGVDDSAGKDSLMLYCDYDDGSWREGYTGPFYLDPFTYDPTPMERATAELIAATPTLITDLLAEVDRLHSLTEGDPNTIYHEAAQLRAERDAAAARADQLETAIREHHEAIWSEWSQTSRSIPPPADVALWAHVDIDPAARFAAERDRGTDR